MLVSASSTQIPNAPIAVDLDNITPVRSVRNLRIYADSYVSMRTHVVKTESSCFTILRRIRSIRRSITSSGLKSLIVVLLVLPRMDYGSATLTGLVRHLLDIHQTLMIQECCCTIGILGSEIRPRSMMLRIRPRSRL